jgi:hypothetical protein
VYKLSTAVIEESKLVAIEIQNFMSLGHARLEFDESGILNLCGYNDSGKSAATRALEVVFYDAYSSDQVNFIQDDTDHFGIGLEFSDGVSINKYKYTTGKSVWEMMKGSEMLYTNRVANGISALTDIPDAIKNYLGVVKDEFTDEQLNVRRNTNRLFLIETTGGDNYKIINSVLRCDILAESSKRMNEDRNKIQSEFTEKASSSRTLKLELEGIVVVDDATLLTIKTGSENLAASKQRIEYLSSIATQKGLMDSFIIHDELPLIDTSRITELESILQLKKVAEIPIYTECSIIDTDRINLLSEIIQLRTALDVIIPPELPFIAVDRFNDIVNAGKAYNDLWHSTNTLNNTIQEHDAILKELSALSCEHGFKICKSCGTVVE